LFNQAIRVGFIGTGWSDRIQIRAFRNAGLIPQGICSRQLENAKRVSKNYDIPEVYKDWESLIASENIDLISIVTPTWLHSKISIAALDAGRHVLCEAPTLTVDESESMMKAAKSHPNQLALIDYELRHTPQRRRIYELLNSGELGSLISIHLNYCFDWNLDSGSFWNWENDRESGGGVLNLVGGHLLDQARWLGGSIERLTAQLFTLHNSRSVANSTESKTVTGDDHVTVLLQFKNGVHGVLIASAVHPEKNSSGLTMAVHATEGSLILDKNEDLWHLDKNGNSQLITILDPSRELFSKEEQSAFAYGTYHLAHELRKILVAGQKPSPHIASFYDGLITQKAIETVRRSAQNNTWEYVKSE